MVGQSVQYGGDTVARPHRTVALVGRYAYRLLRTATALDDCEVVLLESTAHAYSKIKRGRPDLVVMCMSDDDEDGCRVLSMLALDGETSRIPVLTYLTPAVGDDAGDEDVDNVAFYGSSVVLN